MEEKRNGWKPYVMVARGGIEPPTRGFSENRTYVISFPITLLTEANQLSVSMTSNRPHNPNRNQYHYSLWHWTHDLVGADQWQNIRNSLRWVSIYLNLKVSAHLAQLDRSIFPVLREWLLSAVNCNRSYHPHMRPCWLAEAQKSPPKSGCRL